MIPKITVFNSKSKKKLLSCALKYQNETNDFWKKSV